MMNEMEHKERNQIMDIMKGLGIIYVVIGHTHINPIHDFIYLFHMPLFYFISGNFYNDKYSMNPLSLIKSRLRTLYLPFICYELLFLFLHNIFFSLHIYNDKVVSEFGIITFYSYADYITKFFRIITFSGTEQLLGAFWFFTVLFTINVIFCLIRYILHTKLKIRSELPVITVILILYLIGIFLKHEKIFLQKNLTISLVSVMLFYLGYLYKKNESKISINIIYSLICILLLSIGTFYNKSFFLSSIYVKPITYLVFALSGIYLTLFISKIISTISPKLFIFIGKNTIIILALHFLAFKIINLFQIYLYNYPIYMLAKFPILYANNGWWILYSMVGLLIPLLLKKLYLTLNSFFRPEKLAY